MPSNPYLPPMAPNGGATRPVRALPAFVIAAMIGSLSSDLVTNQELPEYLTQIDSHPLEFLCWELTVITFASLVGTAILVRLKSPLSRLSRITSRIVGGLVLGAAPQLLEPLAHDIRDILRLPSMALYTFVIMLLLAVIASAATERALRFMIRRTAAVDEGRTIQCT